MSAPLLTPEDERDLHTLRVAQGRLSSIQRRIQELDEEIASIRRTRDAFASDEAQLRQRATEALGRLRSRTPGGP